MNFYKRSYQPILRYLYTETIKRRGKISLYRHFNISNIRPQFTSLKGGWERSLGTGCAQRCLC